MAVEELLGQPRFNVDDGRDCANKQVYILSAVRVVVGRRRDRHHRGASAGMTRRPTR